MGDDSYQHSDDDDDGDHHQFQYHSDDDSNSNDDSSDDYDVRSMNPAERLLNPPLLVAAADGDLARVQELLLEEKLENGVVLSIHARDHEGATALHWACMKGYLEVARVLVANGANVNARKEDDDGFPPLYWAHMGGYLEIVKLLVENGADAKYKCNSIGWSALHHAGMIGAFGHESYAEINKFLVENGADVNARDEHGRTPLHGVVFDASLLELLIENGADVNARDNTGRTPLHQRCEYIFPNSLAIAKLLIEKGADLNTKDSTDGETPLHGACKKVDSKMARLLLEKGANVNAETTQGSTPLHIACRLNRQDVVWLLVRHCPWLVVSSTTGKRKSSEIDMMRTTKKASYRSKLHESTQVWS